MHCTNRNPPVSYKLFRLTVRHVLILWLLPLCAVGQQKVNGQLWLDYIPNYAKGKNSFEAEVSYQTLLSKQGKWRSINLTPSYERHIFKYLDLITAIPLSYTQQNEATNTAEVRLTLGTRWHLTPDSRIQTRLLLRWEHRSLRDFGKEGWEKSNRSRIRAEVIIPLNRNSYSSDDMWYIQTDMEGFIVVDENVSERFANRTRNRLAIGYRLNYHMRFEAMYMYQRSRNQLEEGFDSVDHIIRLRFKHYFR